MCPVLPRGQVKGRLTVEFSSVAVAGDLDRSHLVK